MFDNLKISPTLFQKDLLPMSEWDSKTKIRVFKEQILGWQLDIADNMMNKGIEEMQNAAYAALSVMTSFIEMIAKYYYGFITSKENTRSKEYFGKGLDLIYGKDKFNDDQKSLIYENLRCGLYHTGLTSGNVILSSDYEHGLEFELNILSINPHKLVKELKEYFEKYISEINSDTRQLSNFIKLFDFDRNIKSK